MSYSELRQPIGLFLTLIFRKGGEEIIKKQLWILFLSIVVLLVGCVSRENDKQPISSEMSTKIALSPSKKQS